VDARSKRNIDELYDEKDLEDKYLIISPAQLTPTAQEDEKIFEEKLREYIDDSYEHRNFAKFEDIRLLLVLDHERESKARTKLVEILRDIELNIKKYGSGRANFAKITLILAQMTTIKALELQLSFQDMTVTDKNKFKEFFKAGLKKTIEYLDEQVTKGDIYAILVRASMYTYGFNQYGGIQSYEKAIELCKLAIDQYHCPQAMYHLAAIYESRLARIDAKDYLPRVHEVISLYKRAERLGVFIAKSKLRGLQKKGIDIYTPLPVVKPEPISYGAEPRRAPVKRTPLLAHALHAPSLTSTDSSYSDPYASPLEPKTKTVYVVPRHHQEATILSHLNAKINALYYELSYEYHNSYFKSKTTAMVMGSDLFVSVHTYSLDPIPLWRLFLIAERLENDDRFVKLGESHKVNLLIQEILSKRVEVIQWDTDPYTGARFMDAMVKPIPSAKSRKLEQGQEPEREKKETKIPYK